MLSDPCYGSVQSFSNPSVPMSDNSATAFFDTWQTYRKVVSANYMYHLEIKADIERMLRARFAGKPFSFLDLGCGDAATTAPLLKAMAVSCYKGVDLSEAALDLAGQNLKALTCPVELVHQDILSALAADTKTYDVIYSSFALHHLSHEDKGRFFKLVAQRLAPKGVFILTDVVRQADESLPVYLDHYCDWIRQDWHDLNASESAAICTHVTENDRAETFADLKAMGQAAGLTDVAGVSGYRWHRVMRFQR